jgi:hypothetical protein
MERQVHRCKNGTLNRKDSIRLPIPESFKSKVIGKKGEKRNWEIGEFLYMEASKLFKLRFRPTKESLLPPWKMSFFVGHGFSRESDNKPHLKFHKQNVAFNIQTVNFVVTGISRCFEAECSVQRSKCVLYASIFISLIDNLSSCSTWNLKMGYPSHHKIHNWKS